MSITIQIDPEIEVELSRQAAAHGVSLDSYAASLLEEAAHLIPGGKILGPAELDRTLQELAQFSSKLPALPDDAFSRESIYRDHD